VLIAELLIDNLKKENLRNVGYTIIPLLDVDTVQNLAALYDSLKLTSGVDKAFYTSIWSDNKQHRKAVDEGIKNILFPALQHHLRDIQPVFANFMVKANGESSSLLPHQDWSFVDEPEHDSVTVWVPLVDVNHQNGNLQVVPGSHNTLQNFIRPRFGDAPFSRAEAAKQLVDIPMKAGEALLVNSRLIHASPINVSGAERVTASVVLAPKEAILIHHIYNIENGLKKKIIVDETFFWKHSCFEML